MITFPAMTSQKTEKTSVAWRDIYTQRLEFMSDSNLPTRRQVPGQVHCLYCMETFQMSVCTFWSCLLHLNIWIMRFLNSIKNLPLTFDQFWSTVQSFSPPLEDSNEPAGGYLLPAHRGRKNDNCFGRKPGLALVLHHLLVDLQILMPWACMISLLRPFKTRFCRSQTWFYSSHSTQ